MIKNADALKRPNSLKRIAFLTIVYCFWTLASWHSIQPAAFALETDPPKTDTIDCKPTPQSVKTLNPKIGKRLAKIFEATLSGEPEDYQKGIDDLNALLAQNRSQATCYDLAIIYQLRGQYKAELGDLMGAADDFVRAINTNALPLKQQAILQKIAANLKSPGARWKPSEMLTEPQDKPIRTVAPEYPRQCQAKHRGRVSVILLFDVTSKGRTANIRVKESSNACFNKSAIKALKQWRYRPKKIDEKPVWRRNLSTQFFFQAKEK